MGKKKIDATKRIEDKCSRNVTYCKRKKGLLKKVIEFSMLCDLDIYLLVHDKNKHRLVTYQSDDQFSIGCA